MYLGLHLPGSHGKHRLPSSTKMRMGMWEWKREGLRTCMDSEEAFLILSRTAGTTAKDTPYPGLSGGFKEGGTEVHFPELWV